jgi:D-lactate dehydrogenase
MLLSLNRKSIKAYLQGQSHNFTINNLIGYDLYGKKVGVIGTGKIGAAMIKILHGLGCVILAHDISPNQLLEQSYDVNYVELDTLCSTADIITIHVPLNKATHHLINKSRFQKMKKGVVLINTARGGIIDTEALLAALESGQVGAAGLDVYEHEKGIFFRNLSNTPVTDPLLLKLLSLDNVFITPHQGFATKEALTNIAATTCHNIACWEMGIQCINELTK